MRITKKIAAAGLALLLALACSVFAYAEESTFTNKTAPDGGAMFFQPMIPENIEFTGSTAPDGGAIHFQSMDIIDYGFNNNHGSDGAVIHHPNE